MNLKHVAKYSLTLMLIICAVPFFEGFVSGFLNALFINPGFSLNVPFEILLTILVYGYFFKKQAMRAPEKPFVSGLVIYLTAMILVITLNFLVEIVLMPAQPFSLVLVIKSVLLDHWEIFIVYLISTSLVVCRKRKSIEQIGNLDSPETARESFYFSISTFKFCAMNLATLGWYSLYWWYRSWRYIKLRDDNKSWPVLRAIFPVFFFYHFIQDINKTNDQHGVRGIQYSGLLTGCYVFLFVVGFMLGFADKVIKDLVNNMSLLLHFEFYLFSLGIILIFVSLSLLLPLQMAIKRLNQKISSPVLINRKFSISNYAFILIGSLMWVAVVAHAKFLTATPSQQALVFVKARKFDDAYKVALSASEQGDADAENVLGELYLVGVGVEKNPAQGIQWLENSATQGNMEAQRALASIYGTGSKGVEKDYSKSIVWYQKLVSEGDADAMNNLALFYYKGLGVPVDKEKSFALLKQAADKGVAVAMYNIGFSYSRGIAPVNQDDSVAARWFEKSLQAQSLVCPANDLGILYATGRGVPLDEAKAKKLFEQTVDFMLTKGEENEYQYSHIVEDSSLKDIFSLKEAFSQYQLSQATHKNDDAEFMKKYSPGVVHTVKLMVQEIDKSCWQ